MMLRANRRCVCMCSTALIMGAVAKYKLGLELPAEEGFIRMSSVDAMHFNPRACIGPQAPGLSVEKFYSGYQQAIDRHMHRLPLALLAKAAAAATPVTTTPTAERKQPLSELSPPKPPPGAPIKRGRHEADLAATTTRPDAKRRLIFDEPAPWSPQSPIRRLVAPPRTTTPCLTVLDILMEPQPPVIQSAPLLRAPLFPRLPRSHDFTAAQAGHTPPLLAV